MARLHQVIAIERGVQTDSTRIVDGYKHIFAIGGDRDPLKGMIRTYRPTRDGGGTHPSESKTVQSKARDMLPEIEQALTMLFNVKFTREYGNTQARANLVVDGETLLTDVPATYFLFLEAQVNEIRSALIARLPVLDPSEEWHWDPARGVYVTEPRVTESTAKVPQVQVLYEPTKEHPAQVRPYETDVKVGEWTTVKLSGQLPADDVKAMYDRCSRLLVAIKQAREEANRIEAEDKDASPVLRFIFGS